MLMSSNTSDADYQIPTASCSCKQNLNPPLTNIALQADGFGLSDRATAAIVSATLVDFGFTNCGPIDRSKIRRERKKFRESLQQNLSEKHLGLYFDGRKDKTFTSSGRSITEEHISVISEPNSKYIDHATVSTGSSEAISEALLDSFDFKEVVCVGCDSTAVNTGIHSGVIRRLELQLGRSLHWAICMLHLNELPLRHLFFCFGWQIIRATIIHWANWKRIGKLCKFTNRKFYRCWWNRI